MWREVAREFILERGRGFLVAAGVRALQRKGHQASAILERGRLAPLARDLLALRPM
jgi:hypothetical protein